jgi:DNA-binding transcriptional ArsR family regulator
MSNRLDNIFGSLSDPTRRDIIARVSKREMPVSEIAEPYRMSLPAISKHLKILEKANLIVKTRQGKQLLVRLSRIASSLSRSTFCISLTPSDIGCLRSGCSW